MVRAPTSVMRTPTPVLPVNDTMSTSGEATNASAGPGVEAVMRLTTPGGIPASCMISTSFATASGSCGAGFTTTVLPMASAGQIFPAMFVRGKLNEVMAVTTPTGSRRATALIRPPGARAVAGDSPAGTSTSRGSSAPLA